MQSISVSIVWRAKRNYQSIAYAKLFSRSHGAVIRVLRTLRERVRWLGRTTIDKEATEWPPDTIQVV
jgi:hypothetical protein